MPFCRKCGRRLVEYSEVCTDCGTSTTGPIINTKRTQSSRSFNIISDKKIVKAIIPIASPVKIKVIIDKPTKVTTYVKATTESKAVAPAKTAISITAAAPFKVATPPKEDVARKPVLSAKHIVKPKKVIQTKPTAPFSITFARPVAGLNIVQRKQVASSIPMSQPVQPRSVVSSPPIFQQKAVAQAAANLPQATPTASLKRGTATATPVATPTISLEPIKSTTSAPTYTPHEIIKSNLSVEEDIITNPQDYETQTFDFDLKCPNNHFWPEGKALPTSKGKAFCPKCGERLTKPKRSKQRRYHRY